MNVLLLDRSFSFSQAFVFLSCRSPVYITFSAVSATKTVGILIYLSSLHGRERRGDDEMGGRNGQALLAEEGIMPFEHAIRALTTVAKDIG